VNEAMWCWLVEAGRWRRNAGGGGKLVQELERRNPQLGGLAVGAPGGTRAASFDRHGSGAGRQTQCGPGGCGG
jgi:hypothetical protein